MAPPRGKGVGGEESRAPPLTAILLADSFTQSFRPITVERPRALLPLVNTPLIDYTLEWLANNGVEEVHVLCCAHADQVEAYLRSAGWLSRRKMKVHVVVSMSCLSVGEALRLMDQRHVIEGDFVLVAGDVVTNMPLKQALEGHMRRRAADKDALMTLVLRSGITPDHRRRLGEGPMTAVVDLDTQRLLKLDDQPLLQQATAAAQQQARRRSSGLHLDTHLFSERDALQVRTDLMDCHLYICSPEVLMLFSDNFDYQNVARDFVSGVLSEEELGKKLYVHTVTKEYIARVNNMRTYAAISRDVLYRWTFPYVPDTNLRSQGTGSGYRYQRGMTYVDAEAVLSRTAHVGSGCCIGGGTTVGDGASLQDCVVGRNCRIGTGASLRGCYLLDNVTVEPQCSIEESILCEGVLVRSHAQIEPGCVLSFRCVIDRGQHVPAYTILSLAKQPENEEALSDGELEYQRTSGVEFGSSCDEDAQEGERVEPAVLRAAEALAGGGIPDLPGVEFETSIVGPLGAGFVWLPPKEVDSRLLSVAVPPAADSADAVAAEWGDGWSDGGELPTAEDSTAIASGVPASALCTPTAAAAGAVPGAVDAMFRQEVAETFLRCVKEGIAQENVLIELNGLKIAEDKTFADCARFMLTTMLGLCLPHPPATRPEYRALYPEHGLDMTSREGRLELLKRMVTQLKRWRTLLHKFLRSEDDQVEVLLTFEEWCGEEGDFEGAGEAGAAFAGVFPQALKALYDLDVIGEEALLQWAEEKAHASEEEKHFLAKAQPFIDWLKEAESEEEASSDEEEE